LGYWILLRIFGLIKSVKKNNGKKIFFVDCNDIIFSNKNLSLSNYYLVRIKEQLFLRKNQFISPENNFTQIINKK